MGMGIPLRCSNVFTFLCYSCPYYIVRHLPIRHWRIVRLAAEHYAVSGVARWGATRAYDFAHHQTWDTCGDDGCWCCCCAIRLIERLFSQFTNTHTQTLFFNAHTHTLTHRNTREKYRLGVIRCDDHGTPLLKLSTNHWASS